MIARYATTLAAAITAASAAVIVAAGYSPAEPAVRTVELGQATESQAPAEWTARVIRDGWAATTPADRTRACKATPAQLRAAAPHTSYDPARYDVEIAIVVLAELCEGTSS